MLKQSLKKKLKKGQAFFRSCIGEVHLIKARFAGMEDENDDGAKKILVFGRLEVENYGDPIIADCCKYLIEKVAMMQQIPVKATMADIYEPNMRVLRYQLQGQDAVVFPGGGMNSPTFNRMVIKILDLIEEEGKASVFFNAIGIARVNPKKGNPTLLKEMLNRPEVKQVTTRGSIKKLRKYLSTEKVYPPRLVLDPAVWVNEAYGIEKNADAKVIGVGVIRPEIFMRNGSELSVEDIYQLYMDIIKELEYRGYEWQLFTNGWKEDYRFGVSLLKRMGRDRNIYLGDNVKSARQLVEKIAGYRAVIAARLHANIIATSLNVPSIGLVWNDKMNMFAKTVKCEERYISGEALADTGHIVDLMEDAMVNGYDTEEIERMKRKTIRTIKNIVISE